MLYFIVIQMSRVNGEKGYSSGAKIIIRSARGKLKLEQITLSLWVDAKSRIMHKLLRTGKLSATTTVISDYLADTIKFATLLESHTLALALGYDNNYCKLQCAYCHGGIVRDTA